MGAVCGSATAATSAVHWSPRPGTVLMASGPIALRSADMWTVRLLPSTISPGQTCRISSALPRTSPRRSINASRRSKVRPPSA
jgi:hypothetical protein